jgi:hypothetical protein
VSGLRLVPFDASPCRTANDSALTKIDVPDRQCPTNLFDEAPEQDEHIVVGLTDQLEPVAGGNFSTKLEGIQRNSVAQEPELEMELVGLVDCRFLLHLPWTGSTYQ